MGVDIGGTFTDVVAFDPTTRGLSYGKAPSDPRNLVGAIQSALDVLGVAASSVGILKHGTTVVINTILQRSGGRTALVTTSGFRDVLEIGRTNWPEPYNLFYDRLPPLVPRELRFEVGERMGARGEVVAPLDPASLDAVIDALGAAKIEAVAVCLLHSYANPSHELSVGEAIRRRLPDVYVSLSHELSQEFREYERTSTVVTNAFAGGVVDSYLAELEGHLERSGFAGSLYLMESNGGVTTVETARRKPVVLVESGPAAGAIAAAEWAAQAGPGNVIAFDMGGTTAKACLIENGEALVTSEYYLPNYERGFPVRVAAIDIVEVGTGGGSIARVDEVGMLTVGPQSAGAVPGPASYGGGGSEPTVTDANLALGRLEPGRYLKGSMTLWPDLAEKALATIAGPLARDHVRAAWGVLRLANFNMAAAIKRVSLERGRDPREFTLFVYGGGGALHGADLARDLGIPEVVVPVMPGTYSAFGMLLADLRQDFTRTVMRRLDGLAPAEWEDAFGSIESSAQAWNLDASQGETRARLARYADLRYEGQEHTLLIGVDSLGQEPLPEVRKRFEAEYRRRYGHSFGELVVEIVNVRVAAHVSVEKPPLQEVAAGTGARPTGSRQTYFDGHGFLDTAVFLRDELGAGDQVAGPAVIEEYGATTCIGPGDRLRVDRHGYLHVRIGGASASGSAAGAKVGAATDEMKEGS